MNKSTFFTGQPVFSQLLQLVPRDIITKQNLKAQGDYYVKSFRSYDHFVSMMFCVFQRCTSLREVTTGMQAWMSRLGHLGVKSHPRRSTLSDANKRRSASFFNGIYHDLVQMHGRYLPDSRKESSIDKRLLLIDSTTMDLFSDVMGGAGMSKENGRRKGGVKVHVMTDAIDKIPSIVYLTEAKENDRIFMSEIKAAKGSILVFDKGYIKYSQWEKWTQQGLYWVTRLSKVGYYEEYEKLEVNQKQKDAGIISDHKVMLGRGTSKTTEKILARVIVYYDKEKQRTFEFVTNHEKFSASNIAAIYKKRWQIELIFKSLKQNYQLRYFLGDNANAISIQIWCSLIADLLMKVIKRSVIKRIWSLSNLTSMIRMHLGTYVDLKSFLNAPEKAISLIDHYNEPQPTLFMNTT